MLKSNLVGRVTDEAALRIMPIFFAACGASTETTGPINKPVIRYYKDDEADQKLLILKNYWAKGPQGLHVFFSKANERSIILTSAIFEDGYHANVMIGSEHSRNHIHERVVGKWVQSDKEINFEEEARKQEVTSADYATRYRRLANSLLKGVELALKA